MREAVSTRKTRKKWPERQDENHEVGLGAGWEPREAAEGPSGLRWLWLTPQVHVIRLPRPQLTGHEVITDQG